MVDLSLAMGSIIKLANPVAVAARDAVAAALNLFPQVKSYFADMKFTPMPRYTVGVLADQSTQDSGRAGAKLTSRLVAVRTAKTTVSPVGLKFPQPRVNSKDGHDILLDDATGNWRSVPVGATAPGRPPGGVTDPASGPLRPPGLCAARNPARLGRGVHGRRRPGPQRPHR